MKKASLTETKNNLSAIIDQVRQGETIVILDRGRPIARIESILSTEVEPSGRLARLERSGIVRRPKKKLTAKFLQSKPPRPQSGASALKALLDERRGGR
jgi:prevent-host-death family protein